MPNLDNALDLKHRVFGILYNWCSKWGLISFFKPTCFDSSNKWS